jgi:hypothetical protein
MFMHLLFKGYAALMIALFQNWHKIFILLMVITLQSSKPRIKHISIMWFIFNLQRRGYILGTQESKIYTIFNACVVI